MKVWVRVLVTSAHFETYEVDADSVPAAGRAFKDSVPRTALRIDARGFSETVEFAGAAKLDYLRETRRTERFKNGDE